MIFFSSENKNMAQKGFTLVEMLVVLGLFSFIMTLATSVLYSTQAVNVKLSETQVVLDNVSVSLETMTRDIRYGSDFHCADTVPDTTISTSYQLRRNCSYDNVGANHGGRVLILKPVDAATSTDRVAYYASTTPTGMVIEKDEYFYGKPKATYQITADDVRIKSLVFYVTGASSTVLAKDEFDVEIPGTNDYIQPLITLMINGETVPLKESATPTPFVVQTSISSRVLDN